MGVIAAMVASFLRKSEKTLPACSLLAPEILKSGRRRRLIPLRKEMRRAALKVLFI